MFIARDDDYHSFLQFFVKVKRTITIVYKRIKRLLAGLARLAGFARAAALATFKLNGVPAGTRAGPARPAGFRFARNRAPAATTTKRESGHCCF